ncbi:MULTISPECIES: mechanosensitive ion channel family protein [unclassified Falsihalocynthiibacter]|uniref:mechanosensitive ion channel family protein n=1 Tax=unclassified Falsihalocynthiibacter TaxID=2854191 RepID=UPI00350EA6BD
MKVSRPLQQLVFLWASFLAPTVSGAQEAAENVTNLEQSLESSTLKATDGLADWLVDLFKGLPRFSDLSSSLSSVDWSSFWHALTTIILLLGLFVAFFLLLVKVLTNGRKKSESTAQTPPIIALLGLLGALLGIFGFLFLFPLDADLQKLAQASMSIIALVIFLRALLKSWLGLRGTPPPPQALLNFFRHSTQIWFGVAAFGILLPMIFNFSAAPLTAAMLSQVTGLVGTVLLSWQIWIARWDVADCLAFSTDKKLHHLFPKGYRGMLAHFWYLPALLVTGSLMLTATGFIRHGLEALGIACLNTFALVALIYGSGHLLGPLMKSGGVRSDAIRKNFPRLEERLSLAAHLIRFGFRILLMGLLVLGLFDIWTSFELLAWLDSPSGGHAITRTAAISIILGAGLLVWLMISTLFEAQFQKNLTTPPGPYRKALFAVLNLILIVVLGVMSAILILGELGVNTTPIITTLGVGGIVAGWGFQHMLMGIIAGFAIHKSKVLRKGDFISAGGVSGVIEDITLTKVGLRDMDGTYHFVPYSAMAKVSNMTRDFGVHLLNFSLARIDQLDQTRTLANEAFLALKATPIGMQIEGDLTLDGVIGFSDERITIRMRIHTQAGSQWAVGQAFDELLFRKLTDAGIRLSSEKLHVEVAGEKN